MNTEVVTQKWNCGSRYQFRSVLPRIGSPEDQERWIATIDGRDLPERFETLKDAMRRVTDLPGAKTI